MNSINLEYLLERHNQGWSLEQAFYTNQQVFDSEWENIWKKYWLFAGTTAEIPRPGDYFTYAAQKDSIVIIRGNKGEVYAHHNTCRHRGSLICLEEKGNAPKLV
jgi:Rieske 2Fe-2S family protein